MSSLTCAVGPDAAGTLVTRFIETVGNRLDVAVYEMSPYYAWALAGCAARGVNTRLLLDAHAGANTGTLAMLAGSGVEVAVVPHRGGSTAHWKLLLGDRDRLAVGTGNLLLRDAPRDAHDQVPPQITRAGPGTREWWVFLSGVPALVARAHQVVDRCRTERGGLVALADMAGSAPPAIGCPQPLVEPLTLDVPDGATTFCLSGPAIVAALERRIERASWRIDVTVPYLSLQAPSVLGLMERLARVRHRGVPVRLLLGAVPGRRDGMAATAGQVLAGHGIVTRVMDPARCTTGHAKGAVIDASVLVGSANWSEAGLTGPWESALFVDHRAVADYFGRVFAQDWEQSSEL